MTADKELIRKAARFLVREKLQEAADIRMSFGGASLRSLRSICGASFLLPVPLECASAALLSSGSDPRASGLGHTRLWDTRALVPTIGSRGSEQALDQLTHIVHAVPQQTSK
ncbi:hypothetical protein BC834DRAFT_889816 [Gloeopeniophorella convolvens]|nr:hypothetical protein BC834DRAFT_889816 [Gloeopeniophorella convolvens]